MVTIMMNDSTDQAQDALEKKIEQWRNPKNWPRVPRRNRFRGELSRGTHVGFDWYVAHNDIGYRCGYVRINSRHALYGRPVDDPLISELDVHGGVTYAEKGPPAQVPRFSYQWYLGFDCAHAWDLPDYDIVPEKTKAEWAIVDEGLKDTGFHTSMWDMLNHNHDYGFIRTQEYVEEECRSLCEQVAHYL